MCLEHRPRAVQVSRLVEDQLAALQVVLGARAEKDPSVIASPKSEEEEFLFASIRAHLQAKPGCYSKVLANIQIYRSRLGEEQAALRLEEDLNRARMAARHSGGPSDG